MMDKAFRDVIRKPLGEMLHDLKQHFPSPEEMENVNEPLSPLGQGKLYQFRILNSDRN